MNTFIEKYITDFTDTLNCIEVTDSLNQKIAFNDAILDINNRIKKVADDNKKVIMVGNGGSAGICSHQTVDYWKNGKIKSINFNDSSLLTCISNDISFEEVFSKPIEMFIEEGDVVYCFSSSGRSKNIINAATKSKENKSLLITFSGFDDDNDLRQLGDFNFYVKSSSYGFVEIIHLFISHLILDSKLYLCDNIDVFNKNKNKNI